MNQDIVFCDQFDSFSNKKESRVFEVFPPVFKDNRGYFCEVKKIDNRTPEGIDWFKNFSWIKQINRSCSRGKTIRGCHAQRGGFCQAKLVQALTTRIYDIITDARPNSSTFGVSQVFVLDPEKQNQLFVPRGFLHAFATTEDKPAIFEYMCDNVFDKSSEIGVSPMSLLPGVVSNLEEVSKNNSNIANDFFDLFLLFKDTSKVIMSEKDLNGLDYRMWMNQIKEDFEKKNKLWYE